MIIEKKDVSRYGVYVFYDKHGIVDEYNDVFLKGLKKVISHLVVICNCQVEKSGMERLSAIADEVITRENKGYDVTAYKEGILRPGFDKLSRFDEVVICNDTMYGPLYPFEEMFDSMAQKNLDFWGITNFHEVPFDPFGTIEYGYLPKHIQSFFMVFRQSLVKSSEFQSYWTKFPEIHGYEEAIGKHEATFTKRFADQGFRWAVYADSEDLEGYTYDPLRDFPRYLIEEKRCPVMKKRSFYHEYGEAMERSGGEATRDAFDFIQEELSYDCGLIWKNILRTQNQADIKKRMQLNYVLSSRIPRRKEKSSLKIALILHIYYEDLAGYCRSYAENMPEGTDVYITVPNEEKLVVVKEAFCDFPYRIEYRIVGNCGRDVGPFIVGCKDIIDKYDLVCKMHDKRVYQVTPMSLGQSWSNKCFENLMKNKVLVENIVAVFEEQPFLGLLTPPVPNHGPYYPTTGKGEWGENFKVAKELADTLGLTVDMNPDKEPVAPLGSMFWVRTAALKSLFAHDWQYDEMPQEPIADDTTVLHAIERIYPFCAQQAGFYPAWVMVDTYARVEVDNWDYMNHKTNCAEFEKTGVKPFRELQDAVRGL
ncbi:MAG: rhamnan synthesis F family protein [Lachnospiraceae bacterium]|nr:rhamnan synthesis F family protein [Lachnospiraceae bacterium]